MPDGSATYVLAYVLTCLAFVSLLFFSILRLKHSRITGWRYTVVVNIVITTIGVLFLILCMEGYYAFLYDETDSYGLLLTCERWFNRHYRLNNAGYRDDKDYFMAKEFGKRRIVFLGDSYTVGHGIKNIKDRFTGLIEERLNGESGGQYEVYTIAWNGWDTNKYLSTLLQLAQDNFQVDSIILCYTMNDIGWASPESRAVLQSMEALKPTSWLLRHSYFLNFLYGRINIVSTKNATDYYGWLSSAYTGRTWQLEQLALSKIIEGCKIKGWDLKVAILPLLGDLTNGFKMKTGHVNISAFFMKNGIPSIDLADELKEYPSHRITVNKYDGHPNEFAHRVIATAIWDRLLTHRGEDK